MSPAVSVAGFFQTAAAAFQTSAALRAAVPLLNGASTSVCVCVCLSVCLSGIASPEWSLNVSVSVCLSVGLSVCLPMPRLNGAPTSGLNVSVRVRVFVCVEGKDTKRQVSHVR
jgi:hypothetical protein